MVFKPGPDALKKRQEGVRGICTLLLPGTWITGCQRRRSMMPGGRNRPPCHTLLSGSVMAVTPLTHREMEEHLILASISP